MPTDIMATSIRFIGPASSLLFFRSSVPFPGCRMGRLPQTGKAFRPLLLAVRGGMCRAADEIVMGKHSQLGPIDPQVILPSGIQVPAGALTSQFKEASAQCPTEPGRLAAWLPTLQQYPPGILDVCEKAALLAKDLVEQWLKSYMLRYHPEKDRIASETAEWLANDDVHLSHSRAITREEIRARGLIVTDLEADQALQDATLSVLHAVLHTFIGATAVKIVENQLGRRYVKHSGGQIVVPPGILPQLQSPQQQP